MPKKTVDNLREFFTSAKSRANHHARDTKRSIGVDKIMVPLLGFIEWKQDEGVPFTVWVNECLQGRSRVWMTINGRRYATTYRDKKILLKENNTHGNTIAEFNNNTSLAYMESVFERLKPTPVF